MTIDQSMGLALCTSTPYHVWLSEKNKKNKDKIKYNFIHTKFLRQNNNNVTI